MRTILTGLVLLAAAAPARAQMIWGGEYQRAARPGAHVPYDGEPYMQRYNYGIGPGIYLNGDGWRLWQLEYLDRVHRAEKFGYAAPLPPRYGPHPLVVDEVVEAPGEVVVEEAPPVRGRLGIGIGFGRWRRH